MKTLEQKAIKEFDTRFPSNLTNNGVDYILPCPETEKVKSFILKYMKLAREEGRKEGFVEGLVKMSLDVYDQGFRYKDGGK